MNGKSIIDLCIFHQSYCLPHSKKAVVMVTRTKKGRVKTKSRIERQRKRVAEYFRWSRIWNVERGQRDRDSQKRKAWTSWGRTDRSSLPRSDPELTAGPSCWVKMWASWGRWHLQSPRLKGSNFTDNMYCCRNLHLTNLVLWDHKTSGPFTTFTLPAFVCP